MHGLGSDFALRAHATFALEVYSEIMIEEFLYGKLMHLSYINKLMILYITVTQSHFCNSRLMMYLIIWIKTMIIFMIIRMKIITF